MFANFRRHQKWIWIIVAIVVSVGMVFWNNQGGNQGSGAARGAYGSIKGRPITKLESEQAFAETRLLYFLNYKKWPEQDERLAQNFDVRQQTLYRLLRLSQVREYGIHVGDAAVVNRFREIFGTTDPAALDAAFKRLELAEHGIKPGDVERFLRNDIAIVQLGAIVGLGGRQVTPREAEGIYRREHQDVSTEAVFFNASNYLADVKMVATNVNVWYTNHMAEFRIPDRVRVVYADFSRSNFLAEATKEIDSISNFTARLEDYYYNNKQGGTNLFKDTNGVVLSKPAALARMKEENLDVITQKIALKKANTFAGQLYDKKFKSAADLEKEAAAAGYKTGVTAPFDRFEGPTDLKVSFEFTRAAFNLTTNDPIAFQVLPGEHGLYVIALKDSIPSTNPPLESVRTKVNDAYRLDQARDLAQQAGTNFAAKVATGLTPSRTFHFVALDQKLVPVLLPPFSISTDTLTNLTEQVELNQLKQLAFRLEPGRATSFVPTSSDGGLVLYLRERLAVDETLMRTEFPKFLGAMRQYRQGEVYGKWFNRQIELAGPLFNRPPGRRDVTSPPDEAN